jgi:CubicO group peptidase (beta-lactamase class C family)
MLATLLFAHAAPPSVATSTASSIQAWIANKRTEVPYSVAPGVSVVVTVNDDVGMWGDGLQDLFAGIPADADTLYEIGSLSKTMSALALAALVTRGVVSWDDPVRKWLGESFAIGPYPYVSKVLTLRDLLSHRTGLNEGQGDFGGYYLRSDEYMRRLAKIDPVHTLRERMDYSNTGWVVAGQVLAAAANASSWCAALKAVLLEPLHMSATYCQRNELSDAADRHLAAVHKCDPCSAARRGATVARAAPPVATYSFVRTGGASDFAWGAADPAGSVISSVRDMSRVLNMLLGVTTSPLLHPSVLREMMTVHRCPTYPRADRGCRGCRAIIARFTIGRSLSRYAGSDGDAALVARRVWRGWLDRAGRAHGRPRGLRRAGVRSRDGDRARR